MDPSALDGDPRRDSKISLTSMEIAELQQTTTTTDVGSVDTLSIEERASKVDVELAQYTAGFFGDDLFDDNTPGNAKLVRKQDLRIVPLAAWIYLLCYLDRSNIGNARVMNSESSHDLETELSISDYQYVVVLMLFLIAYAFFEVPSNYFLKTMTPSRWIAFLMVSWGAVMVGMGGVKDYGGLVGTRVLLGVFEAGLFPGLVYYLTFWYRSRERSLRVAIILASSTLAGAFGGAIAYGISHMDQIASLSAWRWLFILEGIPSVLTGILVWFYLPDYPETAIFLSTEEVKLSELRMAHNGSHGSAKAMTWIDAKATLVDYRLYAHYLIYLGMSVSFSSLSLFTPSITHGLGYSSITTQLMTVPPWGIAYIFTLLIAYTSDRTGTRAYHSAACMLLGALGFLISALLPPASYSARYGCLIIACAGSFASIPPLLGWLSANLHSTSAAGLAIALNVSFGAPGQVVGVWVYRDSEKSLGYPTGHWCNFGMLVVTAVGILWLRWWYAGKNRVYKDLGMEKPLWEL